MKRLVVVFGILFSLFICVSFISAEDISTCRPLNVTGTFYNLTANVTSATTCFSVTAQNVTLDCQNNWINYSTGGATGGYGITTTQFNTTIKNCNIIDGNWSSGVNTRYGIYFSANDNGTLFNNFVNVSNASAIYVYNGADYNNLTNNNAISNSSHGIYVQLSLSNILTNNTGISNFNYGINLNSAFYNNLTNNTGISNSSTGIAFSANSSNNTLISNNGVSNTGVGIYLTSSQWNNLIGNSGKTNSTSNNNAGIRLDSGNNTLTSNTGVAYFGARGFYIYVGGNSNLTNNTGIGNSSNGIYLNNFNNSVITNNTGISNSNYGIYILTASNNTLIGNNATSNTSSALYIREGLGSLIKNQIAKGLSSGSTGIYLRVSANNLIQDCVNVSGISGDIYIYTDAGSTNNTFLNCSYNLAKESVNGAGNELIRKWYYQTYVNYSNSTAVNGAFVTAYNSSNILEFNSTTNSSGYISKTPITEYTNYGGTRVYASNYTVNVNKTGCINETKEYNLTITRNKIDDFFTLEEIVLVVPSYLNNSINSTFAGRSIFFAINVSDVIALEPNGQYIFSTNNTGEWINESAVNFTSTAQWANATIILNSTIGTFVGYRWYFSNNLGGTNSTPIYTLTTKNSSSYFEFIWFSDLHVGSSAWTEGELEAFVAGMNGKVTSDTKFAIASGDSIESGLQSQVDNYTSVMTGLGTTLYSLRGNHDGDKFSQHFVVDYENVRIIAFYASYIPLIPSVEDPYNNSGNVSTEELAWIEEQLQTANGKNCILVSHFPSSNNFWGHIEFGQTELINLFDTYKVKLHLSGHVHGGDEMDIVGNNTPNINGFSAGAPGKFMIVRVYVDNTVIVTPYDGTSPFASTNPVYYSNSTEQDCATLLNAGRTYTLNKSVTTSVTCFIVTAQNVTLDCNGYTINYSTSGATNTYGIYSNQFNTTIKNCNIIDGNWSSGVNTRYGIYFNTADNGTIFNSSINTNNSTGVYLFAGSNYNNLTLNNVTSNISNGIYLHSSLSNLLTDNIGISNSSAGIYFYNSSNNTLTNNKGISNLSTGIYFISSQENNLIGNIGETNSTSTNSAGFRFDSSRNNVLTSNTGIAYVGARGFYVYSSNNSNLTNNTGYSNSSFGIYVYSSNNSNLTNNTGYSNSSVGFYLSNVNNNVLIGNNATSNLSSALYFIESSGNVIKNQIAKGLSSGSTGIYLRVSANNLIQDCVNVSGISNDIYVYTDAGSTNNTLLNCSYNLSKENVNGVANELKRNWWYHIYVNDTSGNLLSNVNVVISNNTNVNLATTATNSLGYASAQGLTEYVNTGGSRTFYSNYTIGVSLNGYDSSTKTINLTVLHNVNDFLTLSLIPEAVVSSSSPGATSKPSTSSLTEGYSRNFVKNQKIEITVDGEKETITINKITSEEVQFSVSGNNYSVSKNETKKFDLNSDGVYDLQISVEKIYTNGIAQMEFKLINEKIPSTEQTPAEEQTQNETPTEKSNNLVWIILSGIVLIGIIFVLIKIISLKRFRNKYGRKW